MKTRMAVAIASFTLLTNIASVSGHNGVFPEKGQKADWLKAIELYNAGHHKELAGQLDQAIELYERARRMYPYDADFYDNLAELYKEHKNDTKRAVALFREGIQQEPYDAHIRARYGNCLFEQGKLQQAEAMLNSASRLNKDPGLERRINTVRTMVQDARKKKQR